MTIFYICIDGILIKMQMIRKMAFAMLVAAFSTNISSAVTDGEIRVLYWNIQDGMWDGQKNDYYDFVNWTKSQNPDICVWCEAQTIFTDDGSAKMAVENRYLVDNWPRLAKRYGHKYVYVGGHRDNYPQVITSRYPIKNIRRFTSEVPDSTVSHGAGWASVTVKGHPINFVTLHLWPQKFSFIYNGASKETKSRSAALAEGDRYREKEVKYICENTVLTDSCASENMWIMLGDFNSPSRLDNWVYQLPENEGCFGVHDFILSNTPYLDIVHEMHPRNFITSVEGKKRIDFIYCTKAVRDHVISADVIEDCYTSPVRSEVKQNYLCRPSDHLPILLKIKL